MAITRTYTHKTVTPQGQTVEESTFDVDVTAQVTRDDLHAKARAALAANQAFLALGPAEKQTQAVAHLTRLTRECSALIRLLIGSDLLAENTDT